MKISKTLKTLVLACIMVFLADFAYAATVRVSWNINTEPDLDGYIVYYGTYSGFYQQSVDVGLSTSRDIDGLSQGTAYYFAVSAYDTSGNESPLSSEASILIPEGAVDPGDPEVIDADTDGIPDDVEEYWGMNPSDPMDSLTDADGDGVVNLVEYMAGTSPLDYYDRPQSDNVLKDIIGEVGEAINLASVNPEGLYSIIPLSQTYPEPAGNMVVASTTGAFLYNVIDADSVLIYRLRVSATERLSVMGEYEPGSAMNLQDASYGIRIAIPETAMIRIVPIGIGSTFAEQASAVEYDNGMLEFDILPYGLVLGESATVTVPFDEEDPVVQRYDTSAESWEDIEEVEAENGQVSFMTQELGSFRIFSEASAGDGISSSVPFADGGGGGGCFITASGF
ncbi:MAG TPA: fibronectin type III domain-containing protein [Deltaproteobacteria bacterium]|nr:fibronectin type III domain-containing protein [Deltaproteobacteria bacterium]